jgi:hypothetical protein
MPDQIPLPARDGTDERVEQSVQAQTYPQTSDRRHCATRPRPILRNCCFAWSVARVSRIALIRSCSCELNDGITERGRPRTAPTLGTPKGSLSSARSRDGVKLARNTRPVTASHFSCRSLALRHQTGGVVPERRCERPEKYARGNTVLAEASEHAGREDPRDVVAERHTPALD